MRQLAAAMTLAISLSAVSGEAATRKVIRMGTVAPRDSSFHRILQQMGEEWKTGSDVQLRVYPGGTQGGEAEMVRRMNTGSLDACLLTVVGLSQIDKSVQALQSMPMMFRSLDEVDYVNEKLRPAMEKKLRQKGYVVLFWADAGWVRFFSKEPVATPADLRRTKLFTWSGDVDAADILKSAGFRPVPLETVDILPSLQTGMIDAVALPPYIALAMQTNGTAKYMLDLNWAPLVGALVVTERSWNELPANVQAGLARAAGDAGRQMKARNRYESDQAVEAMKRRGLKVQSVNPALEMEWRQAAEQAYPQIRGRIVPAEQFDDVKRLLSEYREPRARTGVGQ